MQPEIEYYRERGLRVILVTGDSKTVMESVLKQYNLTVATLDDRNREIMQLLGVRAFPSGFLFDRKGRLVESFVGWGRDSLAGWKEKVEEALSQ